MLMSDIEHYSIPYGVFGTADHLVPHRYWCGRRLFVSLRMYSGISIGAILLFSLSFGHLELIVGYVTSVVR
jgi:hypothetical protein